MALENGSFIVITSAAIPSMIATSLAFEPASPIRTTSPIAKPAAEVTSMTLSPLAAVLVVVVAVAVSFEKKIPVIR